MQELIFHCNFHLFIILKGNNWWGWRGDNPPCYGTLILGCSMVIMLINNKSLILCLWLARAYRSWGNLLLKTREKMGWFEEEIMVGLFIVSKENTFKTTTILSMLLDYLEAKCYFSSTMCVFLHALKKIGRQ